MVLRLPSHLFAAMVLAGVMASMPSNTRAQTAGDKEAGHQLARRWCASCHVVDAAGNGTDAAPAFSAIASQNSNDQRWLRAWLTSPHPPMPNVSLSRTDIDNVVAYLRSLVPPR